MREINRQTQILVDQHQSVQDLIIYSMHPIHLAATTTAWSLPTEYGYVIIVGALIALEIVFIGFLIAGGGRKMFTQEFMKENFGEEHRQATGQEITKGGAPDMGSGRYAAKLSYKQWYEFNNAQRAHYNYVEMAPSTFVWLFCSGLYFPIPAAAIGAALFIFRLIYAIGYAKSGPTGRSIGAIGNDFCLLGLIGLSIASGVMLIQGKVA